MICKACFWFRRAPQAAGKEGQPRFGRCIARPPAPQLFAVKDVDEWNDRILATVWPQVFENDGCGGFLAQEVGEAWMARAHAPEEGDTQH